MQTLLTTPSPSWAQSVRIALLSEGLHAVVRDEWVLVGTRAGAPVQVVTVPDTELAKARVILAGLTPPVQDPPTSRTQKLGLFLVGCGLFLGSYAILRFTDFGSELLRYVSVVMAMVCVVSGVVLIVRRPHVYNERSRHENSGAA